MCKIGPVYLQMLQQTSKDLIGTSSIVQNQLGSHAAMWATFKVHRLSPLNSRQQKNKFNPPSARQSP